MKYSRILAALVAITFVACSKKKDADPATQYPAIPADVTFDKAGLPAISDADFNSTKTIFKMMDSLPEFEDHVATKYLSDEDRRKNEEEFAKMTPAQQAIILRKQQDCTVEQDKKEADLPENAAAGTNATGFETARIYGPTCGSESSKNSNGMLTLLAVDKNALTFDMGVKASVALKTEVSNVSDQAVLGYSSMEANMVAEGRFSGSILGPATYLHSSGNMSWKTIQAGELLMNIDMQVLTREDHSMTAKTQIILSFQGKEIPVTIIETKDANNTETKDIYFGRRLLTADEKAEVGDLGFAKKIVKNRINN